MKQKVSKKFEELYGKGAELFTSPGRINLIGEHTDYNGGFVFPGAVDKGIVAAIRLNGTDKVNAYALDLGEQSSFGLNEEDKPKEGWACYISVFVAKSRNGAVKSVVSILSFPAMCPLVLVCLRLRRWNRLMLLH